MSLAPFRIAGFGRLTSAYAINRLGDMVALVAMAIVVWDRTHSAWATTALFVALEFIPALIAPALTARLDRIPVARVLGAVYALEAAIFCFLALMTRSFALAPFLALVAVDGVLAVAARAICRGASVAVLEPSGRLREGNALWNLAVAPTMALGAIFGAGLVATAGADAALLADAGSFAFGALVIGTARGLPRYDGDGDAGSEHWRARFRDSFAYLRRHRLVTALLVGQAVALVFFALTEPIEVVYTRDVLGAGAGGYGALIASWGAGVIVGGLLYARLIRGALAPVVVLATIGQGAALVGLGVAPDIELACVIAVVGGAANGLQDIALLTALQEAIDADYQTRIMSFFEASTTAAPGVGYLLGGAIAATAGGRAAFVVAGMGVFAITAIVGVLRPWRTPRQPAPAVLRVGA